MAKAPLDHLRSRKKQVYFDFAIPDDAVYLQKVEEAKATFTRLDLQSKMGRNGQSAGNHAEVEEAREKLQEAEAELRPHLLWFRATGLPPKQYDKLVSMHPPTPEQRKEAKKDGITGLAYDHEKFLPLLVTKCVSYIYRVNEDDDVESAYPDENGKFGDDVMFELLTEDFLDEMQSEGTWSNGEIMQLCEAAANVNQNIRRVGTLGNA